MISRRGLAFDPPFLFLLVLFLLFDCSRGQGRGALQTRLALVVVRLLAVLRRADRCLEDLCAFEQRLRRRFMEPHAMFSSRVALDD